MLMLNYTQVETDALEKDVSAQADALERGVSIQAEQPTEAVPIWEAMETTE